MPASRDEKMGGCSLLWWKVYTTIHRWYRVNWHGKCWAEEKIQGDEQCGLYVALHFVPGRLSSFSNELWKVLHRRRCCLISLYITIDWLVPDIQPQCFCKGCFNWNFSTVVPSWPKTNAYSFRRSAYKWINVGAVLPQASREMQQIKTHPQSFKLSQSSDLRHPTPS